MVKCHLIGCGLLQFCSLLLFFSSMTDLQCATHRNLGYKITVLPLIGGGHRTEATWTIILLIAAALALQFM